jgi:RHS repeat-associated protein
MKSTAGSPPVVYVYGVGGELMEEYGNAADTAGGTSYLTKDHLGSTRLVTNAAGGVKSCVDYLPFGEELGTWNGRTAGCYSGSAGRVKFTGKERDAETGLDYFGARYFAGAQGRFSVPDGPFIDQRPANPQSWNLYAYTRNNPLSHLDDDGRATIRAVPGTPGYTYRGDISNPNDNPNFHIFNRKGTEVGRISVQEARTGRILDSGNEETTMRLVTKEYGGYTVPNSVREGIAKEVERRGIQPRFAVGGGSFGGFTTRGVGALSILSVLAGVYSDYRTAQRTGIFSTALGENKITDATSAARTLGEGTWIQYTDGAGRSAFYSVNQGQFVRGGCNQKKEDCGIGGSGGGTFRIVQPGSMQ